MKIDDIKGCRQVKIHYYSCILTKIIKWIDLHRVTSEQFYR